MTSEEIQDLLQQEFPENALIVESCENRRTRLLLEVDQTHLRPGGTVSGPTMMLLAGTAVYAAILATMGNVVLAVTTNLNIDFLRKPKPNQDLLGDSWLMKVGKLLIVGEVIIFSKNDPEPVAHATCTYSLPTKKISL